MDGNQEWRRRLCQGEPLGTGMGKLSGSRALSVKRAVQCPLNAFGATQPPEGSRVSGSGPERHVGPVNASTRCSHSKTQHSCGWWAPSYVAELTSAQAVAGSSYRCQADFDMESVRIACSGGSCVKGPLRLPDIFNLSISNDSCHGKPTTDRTPTSRPKNSLNPQHRRTSPFLHTTQLTKSSPFEQTVSSSPCRLRSTESAHVRPNSTTTSRRPSQPPRCRVSTPCPTTR